MTEGNALLSTLQHQDSSTLSELDARHTPISSEVSALDAHFPLASAVLLLLSGAKGFARTDGASIDETETFASNHAASRWLG